jgi:tetratricopeptide (TPR) repeat protein
VSQAGTFSERVRRELAQREDRRTTQVARPSQEADEDDVREDAQADRNARLTPERRPPSSSAAAPQAPPRARAGNSAASKEGARPQASSAARLRLGRQGANASNTFLHRHGQSVLHDHATGRFYRVGEEGQLREIRSVRRRPSEEAGWRPAASRHDPRHHRSHDWHDDWDDDHFFFGLSLGGFYPYSSFYLHYFSGPRYGFFYDPWCRWDFVYHRFYHPHWYYYPYRYYVYRYYYEPFWCYGLSYVLLPYYCYLPCPVPVTVFVPVYAGIGYTSHGYDSLIVSAPSTATYRAGSEVVASTAPYAYGGAAAPPSSLPPQSPEASPSQRQGTEQSESPPQPSAPEPRAPSEASARAEGAGAAEVDDLLEQFAALGEEEFKAGNYERAARLWRHAVVDAPDNGLLLLMLGQALFAIGRYEEAAGAVQAGMNLLPEDKWNLVVTNWRELYRSPADYTAQLRALEKAVREKPKDPALRFLLGYHYGYLGYPADAVRQLEHLKKFAPADKIGLKLLELMAQEAAKKEAKPAPDRGPAGQPPDQKGATGQAASTQSAAAPQQPQQTAPSSSGGAALPADGPRLP